MKTMYKGFAIECRPESAWNSSFKSNLLNVYQERLSSGRLWLTSGWYPKTVKEGIKRGKEIVDEYLYLSLNTTPIPQTHFEKRMAGAKSSMTKTEIREMKRQRRCTGKTTGAILSTIGQCLMKPGQAMTIQDYEPYALAQSSKHRHRVMSDMKDIIRELKLDGFTFNESRLTVTYNIDWGD
jgi:hypothetical protein